LAQNLTLMNKKLCIVVGVGPGMGLAISKRFGKQGFRIAMIARSKDKLKSYSTDLAKFGIEAKGFPCDVSKMKNLAKTFDKIYEEFGKSEVLVFNVSILNPANPSDLKPENLIDDFKVNVASCLVAYQKVLPQMKGNKESAIIITGGGLSTDPFFKFASLGVGKAALRNLSMSMAQESAKEGVRVTTVTIKGMIKKGTFFDPDKISLEFWKIYKNRPKRKDPEIVYAEKP